VFDTSPATFFFLSFQQKQKKKNHERKKKIKHKKKQKIKNTIKQKKTTQRTPSKHKK